MAFLHSPQKSEDEFPVDIYAWLSDVASDFSSPNTPINLACKRKRSHSAKESSAKAKLFPLSRKAPPRTAFAEVALDSFPKSPRVPEVPRAYSDPSPAIMQSPAPCTPEPGPKKPRKAPVTPSSSSDPKLPENVSNVRESLADQGMYFEDEDSYEKYPKFKAAIDKLVFQDRGSVMRTDSVRKIKQWRSLNKTTDETSYYVELNPQIIKSERMLPSSKSSFEGEILKVSRSFQDDGLGFKTDCLLTKNILPKAIENSVAKILGHSDPKPDFVYGIQKDAFPHPGSQYLSQFVKSLIGVAPGLRHAFFGIENKSAAAPLEEAENQAIRTGAVLVKAYRMLVKAAAGPDKEKEKVGADDKTFAFTCSWVPQLAKIHVHWHERLEDGRSVWHMNVVRYYLFYDDQHMKDFRRDIYNILEWGVDDGRQRMLREMVAKIAAKDPQIEGSNDL